MYVRNFMVSLLLCATVLLPLSASAKTSEEAIIALQEQIEVLLQRLSELRGDNPTSEVDFTGTVRTNGATVTVLSPNGGESYAAGSNDTLTVRWTARKMPKDSTVCVLFQPDDQTSSFLWGSDGCIKAKNGINKLTGKLIRNSGYDLGPGLYRVRVSVSAKSDGTGKDAPVVAEDVSDEPFELTGTDSATVTIREETYGVENPTLQGSAEGVTTFGISIDNNGDKVYGSGNGAITVTSNGRWSHKVSTDLRNGTYNVAAFSTNNEPIGTGTFAVALDNTPPTTGGDTTATDGYTPSPTSGKKPLLVTFAGTINAKKSCGGGMYTLAFGDGGTYTISFPADLCSAQTFSTTHTYAKDGNYMSGLYRGKLSSNDLVARRLIQVNTPQETTTSATTNTSTSGTSGSGATPSKNSVIIDSTQTDYLQQKTQTGNNQSAAVYSAIEKQLLYLAEQLKLLLK